jgi:RNA polymerase sigma factor (sigma-70 family)
MSNAVPVLSPAVELNLRSITAATPLARARGDQVPRGMVDAYSGGQAWADVWAEQSWRINDGGNRVSGDDDKGRFAAIVLPHLRDAYALARSLTGNRVDAEDVVQEACLRAFRAIGNTAIGNARAWVLTIVHNTACTWLSKNRSASLVPVDDLEAVERTQADPAGQERETPETELIARADGARLEQAIGALPPLFRETLVLRDIQGLNYREIAEVTGVPIGTVMSRLARARARLVETVGKNES